MSIEKEILKQFLDFHIILAEINSTVEAKNQAIRNQIFEEAAKLREKEKSLYALLPKIDDFKEMRNKLDEE